MVGLCANEEEREAHLRQRKQCENGLIGKNGGVQGGSKETRSLRQRVGGESGKYGWHSCYFLLKAG